MLHKIMKKIWSLLPLWPRPSAPAAAPAQVGHDASSPALRARAMFARALRTDAFRTIAFAALTPDDVDHYYLEMRADDAILARWSVYPVRRGPNPLGGASPGVITMIAPIATGIDFISAMEYAADFENAEYARGAIPVQSPGDLADAHYIAAGRGEGLIFNIHNNPRPTVNGRAVIPDTYAEDAWNGVVIRSDLPGLERDFTTHILARLIRSAGGLSIGDSAPRAFSEHLQTLHDQQKISDILSDLINKQKNIAEDFAIWERSRGFSRLRWAYNSAAACWNIVKKLEQEDAASFSFLKDLFSPFKAQVFYYAAARIQGASLIEEIHIDDKRNTSALKEEFTKNALAQGEEKEKCAALLLLQFQKEYLPLMPSHDALLTKLKDMQQQVEGVTNQNRGAAFSDMANTFGTAAHPLVPAPSMPEIPAQGGVPSKEHLVL